MNSFVVLVCLVVAVPAAAVWSGGSSRPAAVVGEKAAPGVDLPEGDPLLAALQKRLGKPDRVTGSGRLFLHYDLPNGDTLTLTVSGNKVTAVEHTQKK